MKPPEPTQSAATAPSFGTLGALEVRLARSAAEIAASQRLRYHVFYEEMSAEPSPEMARTARDFDVFDPICDHLLVIDHSAPSDLGGFSVVGTYRLLRQDVAERHGGFYTQGEFDVEGLIARRPPGTRFLELGRSCTHLRYRNKPTIELLWHGIMSYVALHKMDVMFGCASIAGTDPGLLAPQLAFLHHEFGAPAEWVARAQPGRRIDMNRLSKEDVNVREALRALPPLIKGYIRAGCYIGDGAVVDPQFGTTDVLIILPVDRISDRYYSRFAKPETVSG